MKRLGNEKDKEQRNKALNCSHVNSEELPKMLGKWRIWRQMPTRAMSGGVCPGSDPWSLGGRTKEGTSESEGHQGSRHHVYKCLVQPAW